MEKYLRSGIETTPFCPGCGHGILMGLMLRAIDDLQLDMNQTLFVSGIGCAAWIPSPHFKADTLHTLHGRAIAFATGAKLAKPDMTVIVISGDGDLSSIGGNHLIHAARRNIDLKVICANNMIYGMTGGQVASTTPLGARTSTTRRGNPSRPFDLCRLVEAAGASYVARFAVTQPRALIKSLKAAIGNEGFSFVEALSECPTHFGRRNRRDLAPDMMACLRDHCVSQKKFEGIPASERNNVIVTGEFVSCSN
jgi:2-oxoglutarate ferredoxin oxidoreductase subunit beta